MALRGGCGINNMGILGGNPEIFYRLKFPDNLKFMLAEHMRQFHPKGSSQTEIAWLNNWTLLDFHKILLLKMFALEGGRMAGSVDPFERIKILDDGNSLFYNNRNLTRINLEDLYPLSPHQVSFFK